MNKVTTEIHEFETHMEKEITVWERNPLDKWALYNHLRNEARKMSRSETEYESNVRLILNRLEL